MKKELKVSVYPASEFADYQSQWDALNETSARSLLLDSAVIAALLDFFGKGDERLLLAHSEGQLVTAGIFEQARPGVWRTFQPSQAPVAPFLATSDNLDDALFAQIASGLPGRVMTLSITQQDRQLLGWPPQLESCEYQPYIETGWIELPRQFEQYWAGRSKNFRQNINKARNRLAREGRAVSWCRLTDVAEMNEGVNRYAELESRSWKQQQGTALAPGNPQCHFYARLMSELARRRQAEIWQLWIDDVLVAADLCIGNGEMLIILKTTYDPDWHPFSPANLLHTEALQYCCTADVRRIEFYGRFCDWHGRLTDKRRPLFHAEWYRHGAIRQLLQWRRTVITHTRSLTSWIGR